MKVFGNILWLIFGGLEWAIVNFVLGAVLCVTVIGIPAGIQLFQLGKFLIWPMGQQVVPAKPNGFKTSLNVLWAIIFGWWLAFIYLIFGTIFFITVIGIPFGKQYYKIAAFIFTPLGHRFDYVG